MGIRKHQPGDGIPSGGLSQAPGTSHAQTTLRFLPRASTSHFTERAPSHSLPVSGEQVQALPSEAAGRPCPCSFKPCSCWLCPT